MQKSNAFSQKSAPIETRADDFALVEVENEKLR